MSRPTRRRNGKVDKLPPRHKDTVNQMLMECMTYREIVAYLTEHGHPMSQMAISTYAKKYIEDVKILNIAHENFSMMMEELDKYPNLDTTEAITRMLSSHLFNAISSKSEEEWNEMEPEKLLKESTALVRAVAYKKNLDIKNQNEFDAGIESARTLVFETLAKERPDLFKQFNLYLNEKKNQQEKDESV